MAGAHLNLDIKFTLDPVELSEIASHTEIEVPQPDQLEEMYHRAIDFLLKCRDDILGECVMEISDHDGNMTLMWTAEEQKNNELFSLKAYRQPEYGTYQQFALVLPSSFSGLKTQTDVAKIFDFLATQINGDHDTLHMRGPPSFTDIFYILQIILPGMLMICSEEILFDENEVFYRFLPSLEWINEHKEVVQHVLGNDERLQKICEVAGEGGLYTDWHYSDNSTDSGDFRDLYVGNYSRDEGWYDRNNNYGEAEDFAACSLEECGYCGHCNY